MIPYSCQSINQEDIDAVIHALKGDFLTAGPKVEEFEKALADYLHVKHVVVMNSATSALHGAYACSDIGTGDEIITSALTFAATSNAAMMEGAVPIFCDIKSNGNIDETKIEALITPKTKAIVPVDFGGTPVEMEAIKAIAKKHDLIIIEDACHALGSTLDGHKVGSQSTISILSFHAIKPITTFEGGALVTNDEEIAHKAKLFRSHGIEKKQLWNSEMQSLGYNYRLSDVACALGLSQLKRLDTFIAQREAIAQYYDARFDKNPYFSTIPIRGNATSARHLYPILLFPEFWCPKEDIFQALKDKGVGVQVHYKPIYHYAYYKERFGEQRLKNTEDFYKAELSIPCHQGMSLDDAAFVADTLLEVLSSFSKGCIR